MKELERSNRVAMIAHGVINACMLFISVIGFVEHTVSVPVLAVLTASWDHTGSWQNLFVGRGIMQPKL